MSFRVINRLKTIHQLNIFLLLTAAHWTHRMTNVLDIKNQFDGSLDALHAPTGVLCWHFAAYLAINQNTSGCYITQNRRS